MNHQTEPEGPSVEARLAALEEAVARLSVLIEPSFAVSHFAGPVAAPLLKESAQHEFSGRFFALLDLGESIIKYSAAVAFASAVNNQRPMAEPSIELFRIPPTLGAIAGGLRAILDDTSHADWPVDILRNVFRRPNGKPTAAARYLLDEFIAVRNDVRGHGSQQPEGYYESLYLKHYLSVHDCMKACAHLTVPLIRVHSVDHAQNSYAYKATLLMGAAPTTASDQIVAATPVGPGATCLWDRGARLMSLLDFVTYRYCPICTLEHIFFAERMTASRVSFHSYVGNHRFVVDRAPQ